LALRCRQKSLVTANCCGASIRAGRL